MVCPRRPPLWSRLSSCDLPVCPHTWELLLVFLSLAYSPMSHQLFPNGQETPSRASKADKADELDANIRNFAPVARIMKNALPDNAKIAKEAKECMQECVSEFISFITSEGTFWWLLCLLHILTCFVSLREMSTGKAQDGQWGGYSLRHDVSRLRELRRGSQGLPVKVPRGKETTPGIRWDMINEAM